MRSHYQERTATELCHQLSSTVQQPKEKPQVFLIRLLDLKQKILFAFQERDSELKYDPALVHGMFVHSFSLGLQNEIIKIEMKPYVEPAKRNTGVEQAFMKELRELKAEVAAVKERVRSQPQAQTPPPHTHTHTHNSI